MNRKLLAVVVAALALGAAPATASAWASAGEATIHPGVQTNTDGSGQCTANFIYQGGGDTYIGQAAHCAGTGAATDTNGCDAGTQPLGTQVQVDGAQFPGTIAYSSWIAMQSKGETDPDACAFNDLALVRLNPADVANVNPSVPGFGGPTGVGGVEGTGEMVYSYGNSSLRGGVTLLSPKQGVLIQNEGNGWSHTVLTVTPGIPGDSGSGFLNGSGQAIGSLSTLQLAPLVGGNGVSDIAKEIAYMQANSSLSGVNLVPGTEAFNGNLVGAILSQGPVALGG
ncbi:MAG: serine protease [Solirubrobacterales bacterium]|nr:serine protease [Solirubrobacterales bacterium]